MLERASNGTRGSPRIGSFGGSTSVAQWNLHRSFVALRRRLSPGFAFVASLHEEDRDPADQLSVVCLKMSGHSVHTTNPERRGGQLLPLVRVR